MNCKKSEKNFSASDTFFGFFCTLRLVMFELHQPNEDILMQWIRTALISVLLLLSAQFTLAENKTPININTATAEQLTQLKGIGLTKAKAIVAYRKQKGAFSSIEELELVKGIGKNTINKNRKMITLGKTKAKTKIKDKKKAVKDKAKSKKTKFKDDKSKAKNALKMKAKSDKK